MFYYEYKDEGARGISMKDENRWEVAYINYSINSDIIYIDGIERTSYASRIYESKYHFGTNILRYNPYHWFFICMMRRIINQKYFFQRTEWNANYFLMILFTIIKKRRLGLRFHMMFP